MASVWVDSDPEESVYKRFIRESNFIGRQMQLSAVHSLPRVAYTIGEEATRTDLIPYLKQYLNKIYCFDEVQVEFAAILGDVYPHIGGPKHVELLFDIFDVLASTDDPPIREACVSSLRKISEQLDDDTLRGPFTEFVLMLVEKEWFAPKTSAISLFPTCYPKASEDTKDKMRMQYLKLYEDESPLIRKISVVYLNEFSKVLEEQYVETVSLGLFLQFSTDDQDSVRVHCVDLAITLSTQLCKKLVEDHILDILHNLAGDSSWKVRSQLALRIADVQTAIGPELASYHVVSIIKRLSTDVEHFIREAVAGNIVDCCLIFHKVDDPQTTELIERDLVPIIQKLSKDSCEIVNAKLASELMNLCSVFDVAKTKKYLLPLITESLDGEKIFDEIFVSNLNKLIATIGFEEMDEAVQRIMFKILSIPSTNWRTRRNLVVTVKVISKLADKDYFTKNVIPFYHKLLNDNVFSIRKTAPLILPLLIKKFGMTWTKAHLLNSVFCLTGHPNYLHRYIVLFCIDEIVQPTIQIDSDLSILGNIPNHHTLYKIFYLKDILNMILFENWISDICSKYNHEFKDDIVVYAEETLDDCMEEGFNVFDTSTDETEECYLETLLLLIIKYVLEIIKMLSEDKVENVKYKTVHTLKKIMALQKRLERDFDTIKDLMGEISENEKEECRIEIHKRVAEVEAFMEIEKLHMDKNLVFKNKLLQLTSEKNGNHIELEKKEDTKESNTLTDDEKYSELLLTNDDSIQV